MISRKESQLLRQTLIRKLRKIGEIPIPEGHLRRNKSVTTYFFDKEKLPKLVELLQSCGLEDKGQVEMYTAGTILWVDPNWDRRVFLHNVNQYQSFASLTIIRWPA
jgi:hypothetical protein